MVWLKEMRRFFFFTLDFSARERIDELGRVKRVINWTIRDCFALINYERSDHGVGVHSEN